MSHTLNLRDVLPDVFMYDLKVKELSGIPPYKKGDSNELGEGSFGVVYEVQIEEENVAIKSLLKDDSDLSESVIARFSDYRREIAIMMRLNHPCVLKLIGVSIPNLCFAMELAPLGDLSEYLKQQHIASMPEMSSSPDFHGTILDRRLTFKLVYQIFAAVDHLHQNGIIHTDLKTNNILFFSDNPDTKINVKLTDYGISKAQAGTSGEVRGHVASHSFVAPEITRGKAFNEKVDSWKSLINCILRAVSRHLFVSDKSA